MSNKKPKTENQLWKEFKEFVAKSVEQILSNIDLPSQEYNINFIKKYSSDCGGNEHHAELYAEIMSQPEYQTFQMSVYRPLFDEFIEKDFSKVFSVLCHELGHLHTRRLYELTTSPFKTAEEVRQAEEELTTKIGNYLYYICQTQNKPKRSKKR